MKKKTVITTETHEIWVIREANPEPEQPIEVGTPIEGSSTPDNSQMLDGTEGESEE